MKTVASAGFALYLAAMGVFFVVLHPIAQSEQRDLSTQVEVNKMKIDTLQQEVSILRSQGIDRRLSVLEDTMQEVKWLGRSAVAGFLGQLIITLSARRKTATQPPRHDDRRHHPREEAPGRRASDEELVARIKRELGR